MKKLLLLALAIVSVYLPSLAQSKVFKEISEEISSQVAPIKQDNSLVGYLTFTQLEKASEDSFNYKVTIMDENLNEMSSLTFKEQILFLQGVAFENDVLCVAYLKSNIAGKEFKNEKVSKVYLKGHPQVNDVFLQFLSLGGKLLNKISTPLAITCKGIHFEKRKTQFFGASLYKPKLRFVGSLKQGISLKNVPGQGFVLFYGDDKTNIFYIYNPNGSLHWQKNIEGQYSDFVILPSVENIFIAMKKSGSGISGDYDVSCYGVKNKTEFIKHELKAIGGNLHATTFNNDPVSGLPYLSGYMNGNSKGGTGAGLFTINFSANNEAPPRYIYSYWKDLPKPAYSPYFSTDTSSSTFAFRDFDGNTYFAGISFMKSLYDSKNENTLLLKQDLKGGLSIETSISKSKKGEQVPAQRIYSVVFDKQTKACHFIVHHSKSTDIYDIGKKKVVRSIVRKDGDARTEIFPAKEGYIMVVQYDRKEKSTTLSIESL